MGITQRFQRRHLSHRHSGRQNPTMSFVAVILVTLLSAFAVHEGHASTVAFAVNGRGGGYSQVKNNYMLLGGLMLNQGNAYNRDTGVFTAPRAGVYLLSATIMGSIEFPTEERPVVAFIEAKYHTIAIHANGKSAGSATAPLYLQAGETVRLATGRYQTSMSSFYGAFCSFSGVLIE